jgi:hypothetical protein
MPGLLGLAAASASVLLPSGPSSLESVDDSLVLSCSGGDRRQLVEAEYDEEPELIRKEVSLKVRFRAR